jgi:cytochrome o ubiquinol oxidase subunit 3
MSSHSATDTIDHHHDASTATGIPNKKLLMWAFLASDCMFFGTLIWTHLIYRLYPPAGNPEPTAVFDVPLTSFSTFILLMSSLMMALAVNAIQKGNVRSMRFSLLTTAFFGVIFLGCQVYEFWHFVHDKQMTLTNSILGSTFYTLTGTHGLHVLIGVIWLISMYLYSFTGRVGRKEAIDVETMGLYWHFVDIVWIVIFTAVYLLEYL